MTMLSNKQLENKNTDKIKIKIFRDKFDNM